MSFSYAYNPKVSHPNARNNVVQMQSGSSQVPFFFGGSQTPTDLFLAKSQYSGSSGSGFAPMYHNELIQPNNLNKLGNNIYSRKNNNIIMPHTLPFKR